MKVNKILTIKGKPIPERSLILIKIAHENKPFLKERVGFVYEATGFNSLFGDFMLTDVPIENWTWGDGFSIHVKERRVNSIEILREAKE